MESTRESVLELLDSEYGIKRVTGLEIIEKGDWNKIYRIRSGGDWIIRISHHRKIRPQLEFELDVISALGSKFSFVPPIRPTTDGSLFTLHHGRLCTVFRLMPGNVIGTTPKAVAAAGRTLATLHSELDGLSRIHRYADKLSVIDFDWLDNYFYSGDMMLVDSFGKAGESQVLSEILNHLPFLRRLRDRLSVWLSERQDIGDITECIVHGDYYQRNILWDGSAVTAVIDWDESATSWIEYEVANAIWEFSLQNGEMDPDLAERFLNAYTSVRKLPYLSEDSLCCFVAVRRLIEIQMDLFEFVNGGPFDLDYCLENIRGLQNLKVNT